MSNAADRLEKVARDDDEQLWWLPPLPEEARSTEYGELLCRIAPYLPALLRALEVEQSWGQIADRVAILTEAEWAHIEDARRALEEAADA